ncbi:MAG: HmuY family protein [Hyphomicrobiales bacterium]
MATKSYKQIVKMMVFIVVLSTIITSCLKDAEKDSPISAIPIPEGVRVGNVEYKSDYSQQTYYNIFDNKIVATSNIYSWDLGFESAEDGFHVILNSAKFMYAANSGKKDFNEVNSPSGLSFKFDEASGDLEKTAIGDWRQQDVYVIDRGIDPSPNFVRYKKLIVESLMRGAYAVRFADLNGENEYRFQIPKDEDVSFVHFSFEDSGQVIPAPNKNTYQLFFTQYSASLENGDQYLDYLVRGALINRDGISVAFTRDISFDALTLEQAKNLKYSENIDGIGYDWKTFDLTSSNYTIHPDYIYVIRTKEGVYFKLHFTSYYNAQGQKGFPEFAFEILK